MLGTREGRGVDGVGVHHHPHRDGAAGVGGGEGVGVVGHRCLPWLTVSLQTRWCQE